MNAPTRRRKVPVNVSLDAALVAEARAVGVNLSAVLDAAAREAVRAEKARRWQAENAEAIASFNALIVDEGLALESLRYVPGD